MPRPYRPVNYFPGLRPELLPLFLPRLRPFFSFWIIWMDKPVLRRAPFLGLSPRRRVGGICTFC